MSDQPTSLRVDGTANRLHVHWPDETESVYDGAYLRLLCPCAMCRGHAPGEVEPPKWADVSAVRITGAAGVGTYAVRFTFSDGHDTGIYTWPWLREITPEAREGVDATGRPVEPSGS